VQKPLDEKKEEVIMHYKRSYDLDIAMMKADLTSDEKALLLRDTSFMFRVNYEDAEIREDIISTVVTSMGDNDQRIAHKGAMDLGALLWPEKFKNTDKGEKSPVPDTINLEGEGRDFDKDEK
jgi:hypothetical protein